ncbi:MAG: putative Ig domain-containing protein, partial [Candidatus Hydrogenedentes bacterium]|nr:putative Ig domain-containing protein [Candidatus Hydrogenedentota bacterium]
MMLDRFTFLILRASVVVAVGVFLALPSPAFGTGYGSINNFDCVNDNEVECHGFEIEIEDVHSTDITYTYDWNHYGTPRITEDNSDPLHSKVIIRYESAKNPDGSWAAYTAVPATPLSPTDGHQFTDPSVNIGGEHFGVGFYGAPAAVKYFWLIDDGAGNLVHGTPVDIATPTFTYVPPVGGAPARVQAAIEAPEPPGVPVLEFGEPNWVKETRTETHNNERVELRDLVPDDPDDPNDRNWTNGEPPEVEVEWQLLQTEFNAPNGGANDDLVGAPEDLPGGDEVITRRYDFYKYAGPIDEETGEAKADSVGPDGIHGSGTTIINDVEVDLSTIVVVGDYIGAQMAGFDAAAQIGLIDHLQEGELDAPYVERTIVVGGQPPIETTLTGELPAGMTFDLVTGILSGTPTESGTFTFTIH